MLVMSDHKEDINSKFFVMDNSFARDSLKQFACLVEPRLQLSVHHISI